MSLTISELHGQKSRKGAVGIELEVEFDPKKGLPLVTVEGPWRQIEDNSLRNGFEYVTRQPLKIGPDLHGKIKGMTDNINKHSVSLSNRCSVHIHRNIQEFTPVQVWNTILAYWILEAPLLNFCGTSRRHNHFCLSVHEAPGIIHRCYEDLKADIPFSTFKESSCKYGGQNLSVVKRLGSLEYRGMRGSTDPDLIHLWATTVHHIGERAKEFRDPAAIMDFYLDSNKDQFLLRMLPYAFIQHIKSTQDYVGLIKKHVYDLCDLAYFHDDWLKWQEKIKKPEIKPKINSLYAALNTQGVLTPNIIFEEFEDADI